MSAYKGHRGPNVSQYIANLNQLSPLQETLNVPQPAEEDFSAFLNTDFFDVNNGPAADFDSPIGLGVDLAAEQSTQSDYGATSRRHRSHISAEPTMDFNLNGEFQFTDFNNFSPNPILNSSMHGLAQPQPIHYPLPPNYGSPALSISPAIEGFDQDAKKRKLDIIAPVIEQSLDDPARNAAEEDKRRRNTAASARFRVKKKQREQALETTAKQMSDKASRLEQKIQQLETENAWLKSLITEKSGGNHSTSDLKALLSKHEELAGRSSSAHTDGVGTKAGESTTDA